jgi:DNA-directed RNA polymerase specialized sigma24 family protein
LDWQSLKDWSLPDLLESINMRGDQEEISWSNAAFVNIVFLFREDLLKKCMIYCSKGGLTETDAEELANRVFERFYKYPGGFSMQDARSKDPAIAFRLYLYGIARRELYDMAHPDESPYDGSEEVVTSMIDPSKKYEPEMLAALQEAEQRLDAAFSHLTSKHKIIYLTYSYHEKEGRYLPARLRKKLVEVLGGISFNTIRVYKKQAKEAIKKISDGQK